MAQSFALMKQPSFYTLLIAARSQFVSLLSG